MSLSQDQIKFSILISKLVLWINEQEGYSCAYGEIERPQEWQDIMFERGKSKTRASKHSKNLAADLRIFKDGVYLTESPQYSFAGEKWKSLDTLCYWGGDWKFQDGNHFQYTA